MDTFKQGQSRAVPSYSADALRVSWARRPSLIPFLLSPTSLPVRSRLSYHNKAKQAKNKSLIKKEISSFLIIIRMLPKCCKKHFLEFSSKFILTQNITLFERLFLTLKCPIFLLWFITIFKCCNNVFYNALLQKKMFLTTFYFLFH